MTLNYFRLLFHLFLIFQINAKCVEYEDCVVNIHKAINQFEYRFSALLYKSTQKWEEVNDLISNMIINANNKIVHGPEACRNHTLMMNVGIYRVELSVQCPEQKHAESAVHEAEGLQYLYTNLDLKMINSDVKKRKEFCEEYVPISNTICMTVEERFQMAQNCNFAENFNNTFMKNWYECSGEQKEK